MLRVLGHGFSNTTLSWGDDAEHFNANGGAIALGHPPIASSTRICSALAVTEAKPSFPPERTH